jgi:ABC-type Fe3+-hydroxamate transport system substrate-binding protein
VSLVPSLSEALEALGLGDRLVGVTRYCVAPPGAFEALPKVGGTKDADVEAIAALAPDLVIANQEENTPRVVRRLAERGIDVWVSYPRTVREGAELLAELAGLGADAAHRARVVEPVRAAVAEREAVSVRLDGSGPRVFCPIWRDPWMTIGRDTYMHDLIELCGGRNVFAGPARAEAARSARSTERAAASERVGQHEDPAATAARRRYPIVSLEEVEAARPEVILLPDEPYAFGPADAAALAALDLPAARSGRIHLIDGSLLSWYGPRIAEAIRTLAAILANP